MSEARGVPLPARPVPSPTDAPRPSRMTELGKRVLSTIVLLPVFVWIVVGGPAWLFALMIVGAAMLANWEFTRMFQKAGVPVLREAGLLWGGLVTLAFVRPDRAGAAFAVVRLGVRVARFHGGVRVAGRVQRAAGALRGGFC